MAAKPMTYWEWAATAGGDAAVLPIVDSADDLDEFAERGRAIGIDNPDFMAAGNALVAGYYAYVCAFIDALK